MSTQAELVALVAATERSIADLRDALRQINEPEWQDDFAQLIDQADSCRHDHSERPSPRLADDYAALAGLLRQNKFADDDKDRDRFRALRGARGMLLEDCREILECAEKLGLRPTEPETPLPSAALLETAGREGQLIALQQRITVVETMLAEKLVPEAAADKPPSQVSIVNHYVQDMRRYTTSIRLSISIGDGIDLAVIERAATAMGRATVAMIDTVRATASKATQSLRDSMTRIGAPVKRVVSGARVLVQLVRRSEVGKSLPAPPPPIPEDFLEQAHTMILTGKALPEHWVPLITELDFSQTELANLNPLAGLTALHELSLMDTPVSDISKLAGLTALQNLDLMNTQVSDISPLAGLTALQNLDLMNTQVSDISPLADLTALQELDLWYTKVSDISPLANLKALKRLYLWSTQVSDILPLARLIELQTLNLSATNVSDITPIAGLSALRSFSLRETQVSDITPLAGLAELRRLDLQNTQVSDITPLAGLSALPSLNLVGTQVSDIACISDAKNLVVTVESQARADTLRDTLKPGSKVKVTLPD